MKRDGPGARYGPPRYLSGSPDIDKDGPVVTVLQELLKIHGIQVLECDHIQKKPLLCNKVVKY